MQEPFSRAVRGIYKYVLFVLVFFGLPVIIGGALAVTIETSYARRGPATALTLACLLIYILPIGVSVLARCRAETDEQLFGRCYFLNGRTFLSAIAILVMMGFYLFADTTDIFFRWLTLELALLLIASGGLELVNSKDSGPKVLSPKLQTSLEELKRKYEKLHRKLTLAKHLRRDLRKGRL
jgi:hypothetical protein